VYLYDLAGVQQRRWLKSGDASEHEEFRQVVFSPDGRFLAAGDPLEWSVRIWDLLKDDDDDEIELYPPFEDDHVQFRAVEFSPDGRLLVSLSETGTLDIWDYDGERFEERDQPSDRYAALAFSPDGRTLALAQMGGRIDFLNSASLRVEKSMELDLLFQVDLNPVPNEEVLFLDYTPDGRRLVLITGDRTWGASSHRLRLWDLEGGREVKKADIPFLTRVASLSPDGRYLAHVVHDEQHSPGEIHFWDLERWQQAGRLEWNPEDAINDLAFSPDGQTLATCSQGGVVKLWPWRLLLEGG
jgi:WD40 repeat protein